MKTMKFLSRPLVWGLALVLAGCGGGDTPTTYPVSGVVKYDGKPLANVAITFYPAEGRPASGRTNEQGKFILTTFSPDDGAVAGEHRVTITPAAADAPVEPGADIITDASSYAMPDPRKAGIPQEYMDQTETPLQVKIPDDVKDGEITLEVKD